MTSGPFSGPAARKKVVCLSVLRACSVMGIAASPSARFQSFFEREGRQGETKRLEKGSGRLRDGIVDGLGSLALCNRCNHRVQWPLSCWLGDDSYHGVGHLLWIRWRGGSVLCVKRRRKPIESGLIEGGTLGICRVCMLRSDGRRIGSRLNDGHVDAKGSEFSVIRLGESLQSKLRRSVQS